MNTQKGKSVVIANNDVVYLWWTFPSKIKDCLGFSIHRIVNGKMEPKGLYATVGFDIIKDKRKSPQTTDEWPIQSFNWKDVKAPMNKILKYKIIPMIGTWDNLKPDSKNTIETKAIKRTHEFNETKVIFNRGILSTQAFAKSRKGKKVTPAEAKELISNPTGEWRYRLGGQMIKNLKSFFDRGSKEGGKYYAALYELTDVELIQELVRNKGTQIILSNANSSKKDIVNGKEKTIVVNDGTNDATRKKLHKNKNVAVYDRMLGTHIGHNKFVVYVGKNGKPLSVLTGSTNWTSTGLCGQTNNMLIIDSEDTSTWYLKYWNELLKDIPMKQGPILRTWCESNHPNINLKKAQLNLFFSPNTTQKTKPKNPPTPIDMKDVFHLIQNANETILFLVFNPGSPSIIDEIQRVSSRRPKSNPLFVRGAISDSKVASKATVNIYSGDINRNPDTYYFGRITGVAAIPGHFSYFEKELLKLGFATIHDKILVIDPFSKNCVVVTGSHNLGFTASFKNDENMLIFKEDTGIAEAYATHILDVVNHFKWRYRLQDKIKQANAKTDEQKQAVLRDTWSDLDEYDTWLDYYFDKKGFINREKFLFT